MQPSTETPMSADESLSFKGSIPYQGRNGTIEIICTEHGLEVEESFTIPWSWIVAHLQKMQPIPGHKFLFVIDENDIRLAQQPKPQ